VTDEQTAAAIVADYRNACDETAMEAAIVRALQAARGEAGRDGVVAGHMTKKAPPGHIIDDAGEVRKVLGMLPITKDGCVCGFQIEVYDESSQKSYTIGLNDPWFDEVGVDGEGMPFGGTVPIHKCYSTAAAAKETQ
jgi:hypothetical protein